MESHARFDTEKPIADHSEVASDHQRIIESGRKSLPFEAPSHAPVTP